MRLTCGFGIVVTGILQYLLRRTYLGCWFGFLVLVPDNRWQCREDDGSFVPHPRFVGVEERAVAVHEDHGGGEVDEVGRQDQRLVRPVKVDLTNHQPISIEVVARVGVGQNDQEVKPHRRKPGQCDVKHAVLEKSDEIITKNYEVNFLI